ncbi:ABC transporter ATP-binding protein [Vibrio coralliilyticus]|uniref:ABC transporter ATP-binding protein n=1 Tax=Vibrio coralliilyticus TaxID=190893 RepID=UPI00148D7AA7|nr:ABC transporter ATP-binding protein [Vibrio coralliilyticus]MCC2521894.1 ABC transporter ATP-binding protein [Vibrio coralliilyticus]
MFGFMKKLSQTVMFASQLSACGPQGWRAVNEVSLNIKAGECIAIIGPNGSGKSSLLKALSGEYQVTSGELKICGTNLEDQTPQTLAKKIAIVAQHENADPRLTVREYVRLGRVPHTFCCSIQEHEAAVNQALEDVGLLKMEHRLLGSLSGGELQRANIARAFAQKPELLLLDEPTNHLDPLARIELLELVKRRGIAAIVVLHDLTLVAPFADKVLLMSEQKMLVCAAPNIVLRNEFIAPVFGLDVFTFSHPQTNSVVFHFEATPHRHSNLSKGAA